MSDKKEGKIPIYKHFHNWRVFPRVFSIFYLFIMHEVVHWGMSMGNDLSTGAAGLVGTVVGAGAAWFKFYVESGPGTSKGSDL